MLKSPAPSTSGTPPFVVLTLLSRLGAGGEERGVEVSTSYEDGIL